MGLMDTDSAFIDSMLVLLVHLSLLPINSLQDLEQHGLFFTKLFVSLELPDMFDVTTQLTQLLADTLADQLPARPFSPGKSEIFLAGPLPVSARLLLIRTW